MRTAHFYDKQTGLFTARSVSGNVHDKFDAFVAANCPDGHAWFEGDVDHLSQRVNTFTGELIDHRPTRPSAEHEWNDSTRRWQRNVAAARGERSRVLELQKLEIEALTLTRSVLLAPSDPRASARLQIVHDRIAQLKS